MSDVKEFNISNNPLSVWANTVKDNIKQNNITPSTDVLIKSGPAGTSFQIHPRFKYHPERMNYRGEWDRNAAYNVYDVVRVLPDKDYPTSVMSDSGGDPTLVKAGPPLNWADFDLYSGQVTINGVKIAAMDRAVPPSPGVWICVANVPSFWFMPKYLAFTGDGSTVAYSYETADSDLPPLIRSNKNLIRFYDVNYFPTSPEPETGSISNGPDRYWELIGELTGSSGGGSINYRGTYSSARTYQPGDIVRVQTGTSQGVWIQSASGSSTGIDPVFPEPATTGGTNTWDMFAFGVQARIDCSNSSSSSIEYWNGTTPM